MSLERWGVVPGLLILIRLGCEHEVNILIETIK